MGTPKNLAGKGQQVAGGSTVAFADVVASPPQSADCPTCCLVGWLRQASVDAAKSNGKGPSSSKTAPETPGMIRIWFHLQRQGLPLFIDLWRPTRLLWQLNLWMKITQSQHM